MCGNTNAYQGPKKRRVGVEKRGRKVATCHQGLRPVEILEDQTQQLGALNDAGFDVAPFVRRNQHRNDIDFPRPICPERIAVDVVCDAVLANAAFGTAPALSQLLGADCPKRLHQVCPVRPGSNAISRQFVISSTVAERSLIQGHVTTPFFSMWDCCPGGGTRRSKVIGKIGLVSSSGTSISPRVSSDWRKRCKRRS